MFKITPFVDLSTKPLQQKILRDILRNEIVKS